MIKSNQRSLVIILWTVALSLRAVAGARGQQVTAPALQASDVIAYHLKLAEPTDFRTGSAKPIEGRVGKGLQFDGVVDTATLKTPALAAPKTIEAWFRPEKGGGTGWRMIVSHFYFGAAGKEMGERLCVLLRPRCKGYSRGRRALRGSPNPKQQTASLTT